MISITFRRDPCIGCNYCAEIAPLRWVMSKKDGKSNLIGAREKKGFYFLQVHDSEWGVNQKAAEACPVKIISVKLI